VQETVPTNNSRGLLLGQCDESFQSFQHRGRMSVKILMNDFRYELQELKLLSATSMSWPFVVSGSGL
jgi:hypothetical protein